MVDALAVLGHLDVDERTRPNMMTPCMRRAIGTGVPSTSATPTLIDARRRWRFAPLTSRDAPPDGEPALPAKVVDLVEHACTCTDARRGTPSSRRSRSCDGTGERDGEKCTVPWVSAGIPEPTPATLLSWTFIMELQSLSESVWLRGKMQGIMAACCMQKRRRAAAAQPHARTRRILLG